MAQKMQISDRLENFLWILAKTVTFRKEFRFSSMKNSSLCVQFSEHVAKIYFLSWNFFNYSA